MKIIEQVFLIDPCNFQQAVNFQISNFIEGLYSFVNRLIWVSFSFPLDIFSVS